jgi:hypothetical protein
MTQTHFQTERLYPNAVLSCGRSQTSGYGFSFAEHLRRAASIFVEYDIAVPDEERLLAITRFALDARDSYFALALYQPDELDLHDVFMDFVKAVARRPHRPADLLRRDLHDAPLLTYGGH